MRIVLNVLPRTFCGWLCRKSVHLLEEGQNHPIVLFAYLSRCHMIGENFVFLSFSYISLCELGLEDTFYNGPRLPATKSIPSNIHNRTPTVSARTELNWLKGSPLPLPTLSECPQRIPRKMPSPLSSESGIQLRRKML